MSRIALIPGAAKGIGRTVALRLAERGWSVAVAYRTSEREARDLCTAIESKGVASLAVGADVSDWKQCEDLVRRVLEWKGQIDALVQCAGPYHRVDILAETPEGWREMFASNLDPLFYLSRLVSPGMIQRKAGRIVAFSMANADRIMSQPHITAHYLAKVGVLGLVRALAKSLGRHGITVNAISPGFVDTGKPEVEAEFASAIKNIPAGRLGTTDEVAAAVLYLLSGDAAYVNGTNLIVSGGWGL